MLRLRPAGAPGPASGAGVPSDRRRGAEEELEPVFAALSSAATESRRIRSQATERAQRVVSDAEARSAAMLAQAGQESSAVRAELAARLRAEAQSDAARLIREAHEAAASVRETAEARMPERLDRIMTRVRDWLTGAAEP
jgi:vacuolar-type H+-ATPase subunit E/Vma4